MIDREAPATPVRLDATAERDGFRLEWLDTVGSTNDEALLRAAAGDAGKLWLVSSEQTGGRGRRGRHWSSPPGNLYASLLLIDPAPMARLAELGFVAGVAIASALAGLDAAAGAFALKWPNDLVSDGAKFTGLLLETRPIGGRLAVVVGFGVNCRSHPQNLAYPTTDLSTILARDVEPADIFAPLSKSVAQFLQVWDRGDGFARIREAWLGFAAGLGKPIRVDTGMRVHIGLFESIDTQGRLVLRSDEGLVKIEAGDVFLGASVKLDAASAPGTG